MTKRGMMRIIEIDDGTASLEITVFSELWDRYRQSIRVDEPLIVCARIENDEFSGGLRGAATELLTLGEARIKFSLGLRLNLTAGAAPEKIRSLLEPWRVKPEEELIRTLSEHLPRESVEIVYR